MPRRRILAIVLLYVALDLSLAAMPGVFTFESAGSLEAAGIARGRAGSAVPAPMRDPFTLSRRDIDVRARVAPAFEVTRLPRHPLLDRPLRASIEPPPASEEPH